MFYAISCYTLAMRSVIPAKARLIPPEAKCVFRGIIFDVYQWQQQLFDGSYATFEMLKRPDTIEVLAIKDGKLVVLEEEQPGRPSFYGIPGGRHDHEAESELDAAKRELAEETGLSFKTWKLLDVTQPVPKIDYFIYYFLATDFAGELPQQLDAGEKISVTSVDFNELQALLHNPKARYLANHITESVTSFEALTQLPEYQD